MNDECDWSGGQCASGLREAVGSPVGIQNGLGDSASALLVLQWDAVCESENLHALSFGDVDFFQDVVQGIELGFIEFLGAAAGREFRLVDDSFGGIGSDAVEGIEEEFAKCFRVGLLDDFGEFIAGDFLGCHVSAVGECDFDLKWGAALDGGWSGDSVVEFAGDDGFEAFVEKFATDGDDAVGRGWSDLGFL